MANQAEIPCQTDNCGRPSRAREMCSMHYNRWRRSTVPCSVEGCEKPYFGRSYCSMHYERLMRNGSVGVAERLIGEFQKGLSGRESRRFHKYGVSPERFEELLESQGGTCALCDARPQQDKWHIDHDHRCCPDRKACANCIRGILCSKCNMELGFVESRLDNLEEIVSYIRSREEFICG